VAIPEAIRIRYIPDYYTRCIGSFDDGRKQFLAFVVATLPVPIPSDWERHKRWYAVLHRFDDHGNHLNTEAWYAGVTAEGEQRVTDRAQARRAQMIADLGPHEMEDVCVRLFSVMIDGHIFGLTDDSCEELGEYVTLRPNDLVFHPPWNGDYDT
jgi:formate hydrogenlyase regulatory protein HycA